MMMRWPSFREDPAFATDYLNSVLEDGEQPDVLVALRQMTKAFGGVPVIARQGRFVRSLPVLPALGPVFGAARRVLPRGLNKYPAQTRSA